MLVTVQFFFSFPNLRLRSPSPGNIRKVRHEGSINHKVETYNYEDVFSGEAEALFKCKLENYLLRIIRRNPSLKKCIFLCDLIPDRKIPLNTKFNKKMTEVNVKEITIEIAGMARRRWQNPSKMR
jgi:hypothetical protein